MKDLRIVIAGSRNFNEALYLELMKPKLQKFIKDIKEEYNPIIISGCAAGADIYGERFGLEHMIPIERYPAEWDKYGRGAGYIRNKQMAEISDVVLVFWDGKSKGSKHMINLAKEMKKPFKVITFAPRPGLEMGTG